MFDDPCQLGFSSNFLFWETKCCESCQKMFGHLLAGEWDVTYQIQQKALYLPCARLQRQKLGHGLHFFDYSLIFSDFCRLIDRNLNHGWVCHSYSWTRANETVGYWPTELRKGMKMKRNNKWFDPTCKVKSDPRLALMILKHSGATSPMERSN